MRKLWLDTAAGAAGGLLGAWTMNRFQAGLAKLQPKQTAGREEQAAVKAAEQVFRTVTGHGLTRRQKKTAGPLVHYGFGALIGTVYGMLAARAPAVKTAAGTLYGTAVWLVADEIGAPATRLSKPPGKIPFSKHLAALASRVVYGLTVEGVRWASRKALA